MKLYENGAWLLNGSELIEDKDDAVKVMELLYPDGCKFDYKKLVKRCQDRVVRLIGFGD